MCLEFRKTQKEAQCFEFLIVKILRVLLSSATVRFSWVSFLSLKTWLFSPRGSYTWLQEAVFYLGRPREAQQSVFLAGVLQSVVLRKSFIRVLGHRVGLLLQSQRAVVEEDTVNFTATHRTLYRME